MNQELQKFIKKIHQVPYGRISDRSKPALILTENKGTCSSKHALIKSEANRLGIELDLILGIFKMNAINTPKIKTILDDYNLEYIPEAHCYLKIEGNRKDYTFPQNSSDFKLEEFLLSEKTIEPHQVGEFKVEYHKAFLDNWRKENKIAYSFFELWAIRELCIQALSTC